MSEVLLYMGVFGLGWILPEFVTVFGGNKARFPTSANVLSSICCVLVAQYFIH